LESPILKCWLSMVVICTPNLLGSTLLNSGIYEATSPCFFSFSKELFILNSMEL